MARFANIIIDISHEKLDRAFQYRIPARLLHEISPGVQVVIPFGRGNRSMKGYVVELTDRAEYEEDKLKEISSVVKDSIPIESQLISLAAWMRKNYGATMNQALKTVIPVKQKKKARERRKICLCMEEQEAGEELAVCLRKGHTARARLLQELLRTPEMPYELATKKLNVSLAVLRALEEKQVITIQRETDYRNPGIPSQSHTADVSLNEMQRQAVDAVRTNLRRGVQKTYLLFGVTGSGKTEVYMELIADVLKSGRQAIVLIPEIALTYQTILRFYGRFGKRVSMINSRLSQGERYDQFVRAKNGEVDIMIGPRSALFTPFINLGLIIIDEEHEGSYKSETLPKYHARETAIARAKMAGASVVLGSATPSIDSYYKAKQGEYQLIEMSRRVEEKPLPRCEIIDLREELKQGNRSILSGRLNELILDRLSKKQQILLFINRRGFSGFVSCRSCGHVMKCPHCDVSLSLHKTPGSSSGVSEKLVCHYCGREEEKPAVCPVCGSGYIGGFKAGTQMIEKAVADLYPNARILRMDFDTTRGKDGYEQILSAFSNREADILIGTQMIVKGHDFKGVTLVGILAADLSMHAGDYRAAERTFQLLTQAAGRAGRGGLPGEVVIQTYQPEHYSIQTAKTQDYRAFYREEIAARKLMHYPPASNMLLMLLASRQEEKASWAASYLAALIAKANISGLRMIGPAGAAVGKVNDIYRKVLYLKHSDYGQLVKLKDRLELFLKDREDMKQIHVSFDFNPMNGI